MLVDVRVPTDEWGDARLQINGVPVPLTLRRVDGVTRVIGEWARRGPGHYAVEVVAPSRRGRVSLAIASTKLGNDELRLLIEDLEERLPAGIAIGLQRAGGLAGLAERQPAPM